MDALLRPGPKVLYQPVQKRQGAEGKNDADPGQGHCQVGFHAGNYSQSAGGYHWRHAGFNDGDIDSPARGPIRRQTSRTRRGATRSLIPNPNPRGATTLRGTRNRS